MEYCVWSKVSYNSGCVMTFVPNLKNKPAMLGLNSDPQKDASYTSIDYAWYMTSSGNAYIYESGSNKGSFGAFNAGDNMVITYDNNVVRYYLNGVLKKIGNNWWSKNISLKIQVFIV